MLSRRLLRIKVLKALYAHFKSESNSLITSEKNLMNSLDKTQQLYYQMLLLVVEVAHYAETRINLGLQKQLPSPEELSPNTKFIDNALIKQIDNSKEMSLMIERYGLGWSQYPELIKSLYNCMIESDYYKAYMSCLSDGYKSEAKLVEDFYLNTINDNQAVDEVLEEQSIMWSDGLDYSLIMVVRTIGSSRLNQQDVPLSAQFKNDDDKDFVKELFRKTLVNYSKYLEYVEQFTDNWDVERIAFMDNLIMTMAISEMLNFSSIPVKVTMDEYIEISKYYSTPSSSMFINGVLDKIVDSLTKEGKLEKIGRGLM